MSTIYRQLLMLQMIPRLPRKIDTTTIQKNLQNYPMDDLGVDLRTIQRDLEKMSRIFPLTCDGKKPNGWSWENDAVLFDIPHMDSVTAFSFRMMDHFLSPLMPPVVFKALKPYIRQSEKMLSAMNSEHLKKWPDKIRVISRNQPLLKPHIDDGVLETVYESLLESKQFTALYRRRGDSGTVEYTVNPLGLVMIDTVIYLVCTFWGYNQMKDIKQIVLHRILSAEKNDENSKMPENFDLQTYIDSGAFNYVNEYGMLKLKVAFAKGVALHLEETPLSDDQIIHEIDSETVLVEASVLNTAQLRWWLFGFGCQVEILEPEFLRDEFRENAEQMLLKYSKRQKMSL
jgi:predicted DNA-binding transcriptional regulator YafY